MTDPASPSPAPQSHPGTTPPARSPASRADKIRLALIIGGILAFLAIVLWAVRDNQAADDLAVGTCFDLPGRTTGISTVTRHECTQPHDAEVFHVAEYGGSSFPIALSLDSFIDDSCVPAFATYVGEEFETSEEFTIGYFHPSRDGWDNGDRTVTCYVVRQDKAKLSQSVKAAGA